MASFTSEDYTIVFRKMIHTLFAKSIDDPAFGRLRFHPAHAPARPSWEGTTVFPPTGNKITLVVCAGASGPAEIHRDTFRAFATKWGSMKASIAPLAEAELSRYFSRNPGVVQSQDVMEQSKLEYVEIGCHDHAELYLEFWLRPPTESEESPTEHPVRVLLRNWDAVYVRL